MRLYLFDVDMTLIVSDGAGGRSLVGAFRDLAGVELDRADFDFAGRTDQAIHRMMAEAASIDEPFESFRPRLVERYLVHLEREVGGGRVRALPGVPEALDRLVAAGATLGLVTGNIEPGARIKLGAAGLADRFAAGGFGGSHDDRAAVVAEAIEACSRAAGVAFAPGDAVVVGDTERDVDAARRAGAVAVGVATGSRSAVELAAAGADLVLDDLRSIEELLAIGRPSPGAGPPPATGRRSRSGRPGG